MSLSAPPIGVGTISCIEIPHHLKLTDWAAVAQIALAIIALAALIAGIAQLKAARTSSRVEITYNYTERFSTLARDHLAAFYDLALIPGKTPSERLSTFLSWETDKQLDSLVVPNLIEEIAGMYNKNLLHKAIIREFFGVLACDLWQKNAWFIVEYRRHTDDQAFYRQWEKMLKSIGKAKEAGIS